MSLNPGMLLNTNGTIFDLFDALHGASADDFDVRIDWKETPEAHVFKADLPGVKKGDVKVDVEDGRVLHIVAERCAEEEEEEEEKAYKWHCKERAGSRVLRRRFRLPDDTKAEETKASMENGVLTLVVPKGKVKNPEVRAVEIAGGHGKKVARWGASVCLFDFDASTGA